MKLRLKSSKAHFRLPKTVPQRALVGVIFVDNFGTGMYLTGGLLYLTRAVGLPVEEVGLVLSVAGLIALPANVIIGKLSDRTGPRGLLAALLVAEGLAMLALVLVRSLLPLVLDACVGSVALQGGRAVRGVLYARTGGAERAWLRSYARAASNLAMALGAVAASAAVQIGSRPGYLAIIVADAVTFFAAALIARRLPAYPPLQAPEGASQLSALLNRSYLAVTVLNGLMTLQYGVLGVVMPLWIVEHTKAPRALVAAPLLVNTALVVLLQTRVGQRVDTVRKATVAMILAGSVFLLSCTGFAFTAAIPAWAAAAALLVLTSVHTVGELWHAASAFELAVSLAPEHAQGDYQGVFSVGVSAAQAVTPGLLALLCLNWAPKGWLVLGTLLAVTGLLVAPAARLAERHLTDTDKVPLPAS